MVNSINRKNIPKSIEEIRALVLEHFSSKTQANLLRLYIKNHHTSWWYHMLIFSGFVIARRYLYGPAQSLQESANLFIFCGTAVLASDLLRTSYRNWERDDLWAQGNISKIVVKIIVLRSLMLLSWLIYLFWPLQVPMLYDHVLGYFFVFCSLAIYSSASSPYYPLLIFDVLLLILFSSVMTFINLWVDETFYVQMLLIIFALYSFSISLKNHKASKEFVHNEDALQRAVKSAEEAHQAKADFLAVMSHEIRTPMTGITGMIDFLKDTELSKKQETCLNTITTCTQTLLNTLNDILDISKIEAGQLYISKIDFDFHELVQSMEQSFTNLAKQKNVGFSVTIDENVPRFIHADPNRIQQVFFNLLNNAFKFTETGFVCLRVGYDQKIHIEVEDTGIGIQQSKQKKIFQKFSQVDGSIARKYGGSGLGLFIVQNLVKRMGGDIGFRSKEGEGSVFWFDFPYEFPVENACADKKEIFSGEKPVLHILLVDDNGLNRKIVAQYLENDGHTVSLAKSGEEAIVKVQEEEFSLILMDMQMPQMGGIEATREIFSLGPQYKEIPVIALSANVLEKDIQRCRDVGMIDHIAKPINREAMFETIYNSLAYVSRKTESMPEEPETPFAGNAVVSKLVEVLGIEFTNDFIEKSVISIMDVVKTLNIDLVQGNLKKSAAQAHELISLCGNIGLMDSAHFAQQIQTLCYQGKQKESRETFTKLRKSIKNEAADIHVSIERLF